jgi:hypothetical protein
MIGRVVVAAIMSIWAGAAFAAAPVWVGGLLITAVSDANVCEAKLNDLLTAVFHPKLAGDPIAKAVLQTFDSQKAYRFSPTTDNFGAAGNYTAASWTGRALIKNFFGTYSDIVISPASITATTKFVNIRGKIQNYAGATCEVTFSASLTLKAP